MKKHYKTLIPLVLLLLCSINVLAHYNDEDPKKESFYGISDPFKFNTLAKQSIIGFSGLFTFETRSLNISDLETISIKVFPNPTRDYAYLTAGSVIRKITMFDISGRIVHQSHLMDTQTRISTTDFVSGIYLLQVHTEEGVFTTKLLVRK